MNDDWFEWRRQGIGASDIGAILGLSTFASPFSVWADKTGLLPPSDPTPRQRIGHRMEAVLAAEFHDRTGLHVTGQQTWCTHPQHPWMRATVDGFAGEHPDSDLDSALGVVEFKTDGRFGWPDGPPADYVAQVRWQMAVTGLDHAWLVVMFAGFHVDVFEITQDVDDVTFMTERAADLWAHVLDGTPPAVDGTDATATAIAHLWPTAEPGLVVDADLELRELLERRKAIKARIRADEAVADEIDNEIASRLKDAEVITIDGAPAWTFRPNRPSIRSGEKFAALAAEHPDLDLDAFAAWTSRTLTADGVDAIRRSHPDLDLTPYVSAPRVLRAAPKPKEKKNP